LVNASPAYNDGMPERPRLERLGSPNFRLETDRGFRQLEFDADVFRHRDVRILVDGQPVATMGFPHPAEPYKELAFQLDGFDLIAAAWLPRGSWAEAGPLGYDIVFNGRSLVDGATLDEVRTVAPPPGDPYPQSFRFLEITLRIAPVAAGPALATGIGRNAEKLGWPTTIGLVLTLLFAIGAASQLGWMLWQRIRSDESRSVTRRAALGWATVGACYAVTVTLSVAVLVLARS
jgi:hypothetical protein